MCLKVDMENGCGFKMFGKNYDKEISELIQSNNKLVKSVDESIKSINTLQDLFSSMQESIIAMAKVQSQHKAIITFLVNHASVDSDAEEDLHKMMQEIIKFEKEVKHEN